MWKRILIQDWHMNVFNCIVSHTSILYLSCNEDNSQRVFGIYESLGTAGLLFAAAIYTVFIGENYWVAGFLTVVSYGIAAILSFGLKEVKAAQRDERMSFGHSFTILKETLFNRRLLYLIAGFALLREVNQTITVFFNQLQYTKTGMPVRLISGVYIMMTLSGLVSVFSASLTKKLKPQFFGAMLFVVCSFPCLTLAFTENPFVSVFGVLPAVFTTLVFGKLAELDLSTAMCFGGFLCIFGALLYLSGFKRIDHK